VTEDEIKSFLTENKGDILASVKAKTIERMVESYRWSFTDAVAEAVHTFIKQDIVPAVVADLAANKEAMVAQAISKARDVGDELVKQLAAQMVKTLSSEWERKKVFEALLK